MEYEAIKVIIKRTASFEWFISLDLYSDTYNLSSSAAQNALCYRKKTIVYVSSQSNNRQAIQ